MVLFNIVLVFVYVGQDNKELWTECQPAVVPVAQSHVMKFYFTVSCLNILTLPHFFSDLLAVEKYILRYIMYWRTCIEV